MVVSPDKTERGPGKVSSVSDGLVLSSEEMRAAEAAAIESGVASAALMERAGEAATRLVLERIKPAPTVVACGPGANGGDGFVIARRLKDAGWPVEVVEIGDPGKRAGDAAMMAGHFDGERGPFRADAFARAGLIVDALFGIGLTRPLEGEARAAVEAMNASPAPIFAVDLPSGIDAETGAVRGVAARAGLTATFGAKKPGHLLFPGRAHCGAVEVLDIGIADFVARSDAKTAENSPALWGGALSRPAWDAHKYARGHVFVISGGALSTGAARLAAAASQRAGAGVTTMLSPPGAAFIHAAHLTSAMVRSVRDNAEIVAALNAKADYPRAAVFGPGAGVGEETAARALAILGSGAAAVLDADALTSFEGDPPRLFADLRPDDVLTPHPGEFRRLFGETGENRLAAAREAAARAGAVVVLKGADTVIAAPDGRAAINANAPPNLAVAGAGDALAGLIAGVRAQGAPGFEAAAAGVWLHGAAGQAAGPGLIAEDLPAAMPAVWRRLLRPQGEGSGS